MLILIPLITTAVMAALAYVEWKRHPHWSLVPGMAVAAAGLVSGTSWFVWLMMVIL